MKQILYKKSGRWGFVNESERYESLILHSKICFHGSINNIYCYLTSNKSIVKGKIDFDNNKMP